MKLTLEHFWLPKFGNEETEYEDAFAPKSSGTIYKESFSLAVADGATESSFAGAWAKMLTRDFVKEPFADIENLQARTKLLSDRWQAFVKHRPMPWYAEEKASLGAFATLLGVQLVQSETKGNTCGSWSAIAIGDTCLFQVRNDNLILSFPISSAMEFGNTPTLLSSNLANNQKVWDKVKFYTAEWHVGDTFLLATDALAHWFLSEHERNQHPWDILLGITKDSAPFESFRTWAYGLRISSKMKNDDITLLLVRL